MRFLFINQYYAPDFAATAQQLADLCERLAAAGHDVHVLTSRALYDGRPIPLPKYEEINGVKVHRVRLGNPGRARFRDRLSGYLSFYAHAALKTLTLPRPDVVVTLTTPPLVALLGASMRFTRRARLVNWVMDIYPDIAERAGVLKRFKLASPIWDYLAKVGYRASHKVIVLGSEMRRSLIDKGIPARKIDVFPSWACGDKIYPVVEERNGFHKKHIRPGRFTLMYSGNMGACHTFRALIDGMHLVREEDGLDLLFVGSGKRQDELREKLGTHSGHVRFLPYQDREHLHESLSAPDAHLVSLSPEYDGLLVPSKIYGIMAAGKAVVFLGSRRNEIAQIIEKSQCGVVIPPDDSEELVKALRNLAADRGETKRMGERGRIYFQKHFDLRLTCDRMIGFLEAAARREAPARRTAKPGSVSALRPEMHVGDTERPVSVVSD